MKKTLQFLMVFNVKSKAVRMIINWIKCTAHNVTLYPSSSYDWVKSISARGKKTEIGQIFSAPAIQLSVYLARININLIIEYSSSKKKSVYGSSNWEIVFITQKKGEQVFINTFYL